MTASTTSPTSTRALSIAARIGLVLAALLGVFDLVTAIPMIADGPQMWLLVAGGLGSLAFQPFAWRGIGWGKTGVVASRLVSALSGLPAFFIDDIPAEAVIFVSAGIGLSLLITVLVFIPAKGANGTSPA